MKPLKDVFCMIYPVLLCLVLEVERLNIVVVVGFLLSGEKRKFPFLSCCETVASLSSICIDTSIY